MEVITRYACVQYSPQFHEYARNIGKETLLTSSINGTPFDKSIDPFLLPATKTNIVLTHFNEIYRKFFEFFARKKDSPVEKRL